MKSGSGCATRNYVSSGGTRSPASVFDRTTPTYGWKRSDVPWTRLLRQRAPGLQNFCARIAGCDHSTEEPRLILRPAQVLVQEFESAFSVDLMRAVEELDRSAVRHAHPRIVEPSYFGILVGDPFVRRHHVAMP